MNSLSQTQEFGQIPFYNVETGNPILSPDSIQITTEDSHSYTGATSASGGHITAPLIGLRIISGQERGNKEKLPYKFTSRSEYPDEALRDRDPPLHRVEVRRAVVTSHRIQQVIQNTDADATSPFTHRRHHPPLVGLGIVTLHAGDGVTAAPTTNYRTRRREYTELN